MGRMRVVRSLAIQLRCPLSLRVGRELAITIVLVIIVLRLLSLTVDAPLTVVIPARIPVTTSVRTSIPSPVSTPLTSLVSVLVVVVVTVLVLPVILQVTLLCAVFTLELQLILVADLSIVRVRSRELNFLLRFLSRLFLDLLWILLIFCGSSSSAALCLDRRPELSNVSHSGTRLRLQLLLFKLKDIDLLLQVSILLLDDVHPLIQLLHFQLAQLKLILRAFKLLLHLAQLRRRRLPRRLQLGKLTDVLCRELESTLTHPSCCGSSRDSS